MNYIYQVDGYRNGRYVVAETFATKEKAEEFALDLKYQRIGLDKIVLEARTPITNLCHSKKVWLWQRCGRWDNGTYYKIDEDKRAGNSLAMGF